MRYDIREARHIEGYKIELSFEDGKKGIVDLQSYLKKAACSAVFLISNISKTCI